ncbi:MAG: hypothetical protein AAF191_19610 [Verrucomicrobiota bacterium]
MNDLLGADSVFVLVCTGFTLLMAVRAFQKGALESIWNLTSWGGGAFAGWWMFGNGADLLRTYADINLGEGAAVFAGVILGVVAFAVVRKVAKTIFERVFGPDKLLGRWMYGGTGSIVSTLPSFALILFVAVVVRSAGTMMELNQIDQVTASRQEWTEETYPQANIVTSWRDSLEGLPRGEKVLDVVDPLGSTAKRHLAAYLLASFNPYVRDQMVTWPRTKEVASHPLIEDLERDSELTELIAGRSGEWKYFRLLRHPRVRAAVQDPALRKKLRKMDTADEIRAILTGQSPRKRLPWLQRILK